MGYTLLEVLFAMSLACILAGISVAGVGASIDRSRGAAAARYLSTRAALARALVLEPELMLAGHGLPIFGTSRIVKALTDTAELLESLEAQTLNLMNQGLNLDQTLHLVEVPEHLRDLPFLRPVYDHPQFIVRNIWRRFGGWYDGDPDHLLPAPRQRFPR